MIEWRGSSFNSMPRLEGGDGEREEGVEEEGNFLITRRVEVEEEIKAISLHVLTTNQIAVRFYEQNGFTRLRTLKGFYTIQGQLCDAHL